MPQGLYPTSWNWVYTITVLDESIAFAAPAAPIPAAPPPMMSTLRATWTHSRWYGTMRIHHGTPRVDYARRTLAMSTGAARRAKHSRTTGDQMAATNALAAKTEEAGPIPVDEIVSLIGPKLRALRIAQR